MGNIVVFDLDGTLVDSMGDIHVAVNRMLDIERCELISLERLTSFVGNGLPTLIKLVMQEYCLPETEYQRLHDMVLGFYETMPVEQSKCYPGVLAALDELRAQGVRLGLCTNKPHGAAVHLLEALELADHFEVILGGDSLAERKPHAMPLLHCIDALGSGAVLYVGDSEVDAATAVNAKVDFALFTEGYRKSPAKDIPHKVLFADFAELPEIVRCNFEGD
ncbi:phosphoglycolate phosphatase [Shimia abyssi]|uniref:phosphoglycolate phosphatase n=1 Tax=Shimia abyssi TaxID=1662395 RepID=A0A2P8FJI5_9RHOB|nr:phosphoglycolate phosphatase [Shimia abyssi]PSL21829.1 phosphoglycolate phosphatase [Shimia abyssi]